MGFVAGVISGCMGAFGMWAGMRGMVRDTRQERDEARREADAARLARDRWRACYRHATGQCAELTAENSTLRARLSRAGQPRGERGKFAGVAL